MKYVLLIIVFVLIFISLILITIKYKKYPLQESFQNKKYTKCESSNIRGIIKDIFSKNKITKDKYLMLHAYSVKFMINEKRYEYTVDVPEHFKKMLKIC